MNVYHKVLVELYAASGGKDTQVVDLKELVKGMGFLGNYPDIFKQLSRQGWVAETRRPDVVCITHWGIKEARKVSGGEDSGPDPMLVLHAETNRLRENFKEFVILLDEFARDKESVSFGDLEKKFRELGDGMEKIKAVV